MSTPTLIGRLCGNEVLGPAAVEESDTDLLPTLANSNVGMLNHRWTELNPPPATSRWDLTANIPMAVTTLLLSELVSVWYALAAKLGSASVRPPLAVLGGMMMTAKAR